MNEAICSPPKLRRLVHLDKDFGVVSTASPILPPLKEKSSKKLPIPRLKLPEGFNNVSLPAQSSPLSLPQPSPRRSVTATPLVMAQPITSTPNTLFGSVKEISSSSLCMEGELVDGALDNVVSLPQMVTDVSLVQKGQSNEISKHNQVLAQLEIEVQKEVKKKNEMLLDISSMTKKIYITEDLVSKKHKSCEVLEDEIEKLVMNNSDVEKLKYLKLKEIEKVKSIYEENKGKLIEYTKLVKDYEEHSPVYKQYQDKKNTVNVLQEKYNEMHRNEENSRNIISGEKEEEIKKEIKELESTQIDLENQLESTDIQIEQVNKQKDKVQQNINVLHKRNAAQLTRLKRQVKDQQFRHQQWLDQISHLNKIISDLKQQIEEC